MRVGETVNTPHGDATVLGFERFDAEGQTAPMADTYSGGERIICKLSPNHTALGYYDKNNYALYTHEYEELNL